MNKPICERAEVALEYPDKLYIGSFATAASARPQICRRTSLAAIGVALVMLVFAWNVVGTALKACLIDTDQGRTR